MINNTPLTRALSVDGLENVTADELYRVRDELSLRRNALDAGSIGDPASEEQADIAVRLALNDAARNFVPNGDPMLLSITLKQNTVGLMRQLLEKGDGATIDARGADIAATLAELEGERMFKRIVNSPCDLNAQEDSVDHAESHPLDVVAKVLEAGGLKFGRGDDAIRSSVKAGPLHCQYVFKTHATDLEFWLSLPMLVPQEWRMKVAIALNVINWKLLIGSFEMDEDDGEVHFRVGMPLHGALPTAPQIKCIFESSLGAVREYGVAIIEAGLTDHANDWLIARAEKEFESNAE